MDKRSREVLSLFTDIFTRYYVKNFHFYFFGAYHIYSGRNPGNNIYASYQSLLIPSLSAHLGVIFDTSLSFDNNVNSIVHIFLKPRSKLMSVFVSPRLDYCNYLLFLTSSRELEQCCSHCFPANGRLIMSHPFCETCIYTGC